MKTFNLTNLNTSTSGLASETTTPLKSSDTILGDLFTTLEATGYSFQSTLTSYMVGDSETVSVAVIDTEEVVDLETFVSQLAGFSGRIYEWEYISISEPIASLYNAVGEWDMLYFLEKEDKLILGINDKFLALRVNA